MAHTIVKNTDDVHEMRTGERAGLRLAEQLDITPATTHQYTFQISYDVRPNSTTCCLELNTTEK